MNKYVVNKYLTWTPYKIVNNCVLFLSVKIIDNVIHTFPFSLDNCHIEGYNRFKSEPNISHLITSKSMLYY